MGSSGPADNFRNVGDHDDRHDGSIAYSYAIDFRHNQPLSARKGSSVRLRMGVPCWLYRIMDGIQLRGYASAMGTAQLGTDFSDDGGYQSLARQFSTHV